MNLTVNLGYNFSSRPDTENSASAATGVGLALTRKLSIMGELSTDQVFTKNAEGVREALIKANLGAVATVSREFLVFGSVGQSLYDADQLNHTYVLAGVRL